MVCSVIIWYQEARKWNQVFTFVFYFLSCHTIVENFIFLIMQSLMMQTAIPILIGTKFDEFIQLPIDLQWTIASQVHLFVLPFLLKPESINQTEQIPLV